MFADWIKMRTDLFRDPKVCLIADMLLNDGGELSGHVNQMTQRKMAITRNVLRNATVGALVAVWGVTRHRGKRAGDDLFVANARADLVDDICEIPGFGDAMVKVGWITESKDGLSFPRFFEDFNVEPNELQKEKNKIRQQRFRDKRNAPRNVTKRRKRNAREEKRREEKENNNTPLFPHELNDQSFLESWTAFETHRKEIGKAVTPTSRGRLLTKLSRWGSARSVAAIEYSIGKGWQGIFEEQENVNGRKVGHDHPARVRAEPGKYDGIGITCGEVPKTSPAE